MRLRSALVLVTIFWAVGGVPALAAPGCDATAAVGVDVLYVDRLPVSVEVHGIATGGCDNSGAVVTAQLEGAGQGVNACVEAGCGTTARTAEICCPISLGAPIVATAEAAGPAHSIGFDTFIQTMEDCKNYLMN